MIILGIDFGDVRTGLARVDTACPVVTPLGTIIDRSVDGTAEKAAEAALSQKAALIVLGLPKNMDGSEGFRSEKTRRFGDKLTELCGIEIKYCDERLTSCYAHTVMNMTDTRGKKRKDSVDALSATIILQSYVDSL